MRIDVADAASIATTSILSRRWRFRYHFFIFFFIDVIFLDEACDWWVDDWCKHFDIFDDYFRRRLLMSFDYCRRCRLLMCHWCDDAFDWFSIIDAAAAMADEDFRHAISEINIFSAAVWLSAVAGWWDLPYRCSRCVFLHRFQRPSFDFLRRYWFHVIISFRCSHWCAVITISSSIADFFDFRSRHGQTFVRGRCLSATLITWNITMIIDVRCRHFALRCREDVQISIRDEMRVIDFVTCIFDVAAFDFSFSIFDFADKHCIAAEAAADFLDGADFSMVIDFSAFDTLLLFAVGRPFSMPWPDVGLFDWREIFSTIIFVKYRKMQTLTYRDDYWLLIFRACCQATFLFIDADWCQSPINIDEEAR